jgi:lipopolysaccharide export system permease protein
VVGLRIAGFAASSAAVRTPWALLGVYGAPAAAILLSTALAFQGQRVRGLGARLARWAAHAIIPRLPQLKLRRA